jgi:hypothetical protein
MASVLNTPLATPPVIFGAAFLAGLPGVASPLSSSVSAIVSTTGVLTNPANVVCGQKAIAATGTAVALVGNPLVNGVVVKAKTGNLAKVFVGPSGVNTVDDGTGLGYPLLPGESISFGVTSTSAIFINGTAGDIVYFAGN